MEINIRVAVHNGYYQDEMKHDISLQISENLLDQLTPCAFRDIAGNLVDKTVDEYVKAHAKPEEQPEE